MTMKHILDQRVILLYILAGASGDRTRRGPLCQSWTSDSSENGEGLDGLDPSVFHRPFGAESWGPMGNQWEINGKSMGNHFGSLQNDQENYEEP